MDPTTLQGQAVVGGVPQMAMQPQGQRNWTQLILESIQRQHNPQGWRKAVTPQERTVNVMKLSVPSSICLERALPLTSCLADRCVQVDFACLGPGQCPRESRASHPCRHRFREEGV